MMIFASHAKGRGFNPLTAHDCSYDSHRCHEDRAFALIHGHLLNLTSLSEISGRSGAFLCPRFGNRNVPPNNEIPRRGHSFPWGVLP